MAKKSVDKQSEAVGDAAGSVASSEARTGKTHYQLHPPGGMTNRKARTHNQRCSRWENNECTMQVFMVRKLVFKSARRVG
ncbi:hypothetical protein AG1IA_07949 [Rhizoctonia solani AG-1 IA]|uniref:Uncharacterized protein n=1 Tax=Thanatephorus cucumeris (strain AG1-IA) TaxID=983506 RepID=L8WIH4_THACA|nr:hypothetical protein AG1IA_07949 [Rhizoctonia solani AG-1 IA]